MDCLQLGHGYQGGKVDIRPRVRGADSEEMPLLSWTAAATQDWLGKTAMNLMLIGVATRKILVRRSTAGGATPAH